MVKMKLGKGVCSASWNGIVFKPTDKNGIVEVPPEAVKVLMSHGAVPAEDNPAIRELLEKE